MLKTYRAKTNSLGWIGALGAAAGLTALIFAIIPFSHMVNKPTRTIEIVKSSAVDVSAENQEQAPPPVAPAEKVPEAIAAPQLTEAAQQIPINADLEVAAGSGGVLAGFGEIRTLTAAQAIKDETFDVSELEQRPEPTTQVAPVYPAELRKARVEGQVTLAFVLSEEGRVEEARVENSSRPEFEKPALEAIRKWRFRPGVRNGQAVRTFVRVPMKFRVSTS